MTTSTRTDEIRYGGCPQIPDAHRREPRPTRCDRCGRSSQKGKWWSVPDYSFAAGAYVCLGCHQKAYDAKWGNSSWA